MLVLQQKKKTHSTDTHVNLSVWSFLCIMMELYRIPLTPIHLLVKSSLVSFFNCNYIVVFSEIGQYILTRIQSIPYERVQECMCGPWPVLLQMTRILNFFVAILQGVEHNFHTNRIASTETNKNAICSVAEPFVD